MGARKPSGLHAGQRAVERGAVLLQLVLELGWRETPEVGVRHRVAGDLVPVRRELRDQVGVVARDLADGEERRAHAGAAEQRR